MPLPVLLAFLVASLLTSVGRPAAQDPGREDSAEDAEREADLRAARELFERNLRAIQERDREAYLGCYRRGPRLVRVGPDGMQLGYEGLAEGTPADGSDVWPFRLEARDLRLASVADGWVFGTYRYRVRFRAEDEPVDGISTRLFRRDGDGWRIVVSSAYGAPPGVAAPPVALVGATVYSGDGGAPIRDAVVVVRDGRIAAVGPRGATPVPAGVDVVDLSGRYVVPGLIDTHVHYSQTGWADGRPDAVDVRESYPYPEAMAACREHPERFHRAFLHSGVTAVFDVGGYPWTRELRARTEPSFDAPHVSATGALLSSLDPPPLRLPDARQFVLMESEEEVRAAVRSHAAAGSDAIKIWYIVRQPSELDEIAAKVEAAGDEARALGLPLVVHATTLESARRAVEAGAHLLVHSVEDVPVDDDFVAAAVESGVFYCPTLTVRDGYAQLYRRELSDEVRAQLDAVHPDVRARVLATETLPAVVAPGRLDAIEQQFRRQRETMDANLLRLRRAGVPVVLGTDAGNPLTLHGPSVFPELEAMQAAGLTPLEVLTAATRDAARAMSRGDDLGLVAPGRVADLVVLADDPAQDARHLRSILLVMRNGLLHERASLAR